MSLRPWAASLARIGVQHAVLDPARLKGQRVVVHENLRCAPCTAWPPATTTAG